MVIYKSNLRRPGEVAGKGHTVHQLRVDEGAVFRGVNSCAMACTVCTDTPTADMVSYARD